MLRTLLAAHPATQSASSSREEEGRRARTLKAWDTRRAKQAATAAALHASRGVKQQKLSFGQKQQGVDSGEDSGEDGEKTVTE